MRRTALAAAVLLLTIPSSAFAFWPGFPFAPTGESATKGIPVGPVTLCQKTVRAAGIAVPVFIPGRCRDTQPPPPPPAAPTVELSAASTTIVTGSSTSLTWSSTNTTSCAASGGWSGAKATSGTEPISPATTTAYSIECIGAGGTTTDSVIVTVTPAPEPEPEPEELTVSLTASRFVVHEGSSSEATTTLTWESVGAASCTASGAPEWIGAKPFSGSETVTPTADVTYTIACTNGEDTVSASVSVDFVPEEEPEPEGKLLITEVLYDLGTGQGSESGNEWVELYNGTDAAIDLSGYTIRDSAGGDIIPDGSVLASGQFAIVTATSTTADFWVFPTSTLFIVLGSNIGSNGLGNTSDLVELRDIASTTVDLVAYGTSTPAFDPPVAGVTAGHSIARMSLSTDTDTAADWVDDDTPNPGQ